jgi:putative transcriptional regulator
MTKNYKSDAMAAIHETAEALFDSGIIDKMTMRNFDETCLAPAETLSPEKIRELREREKMSQPVFARYLNVTKGLVSAWERGTKKPSGPAMRLLNIVEKNGIHSMEELLKSSPFDRGSFHKPCKI